MSSSKPITSIATQADFDALCHSLLNEKAIALDTEFMRTNTFYAKIGLLQLATPTALYLVDPLPIPDWSAFNRLISCPSVSIVVHSASEDLNLLLTHCGVIPVNLFDTQIAAAFLGLGFSLSYQALVEGQLGVRIEKEETRSDWLRRPLSDKQLHYAANDVLYLLEIADKLQLQLQELNRLAWFKDECDVILQNAKLVESESYWAILYSNISNAWRLSDKGLSYLRKLCIWREEESRRRDRPRSWVAKDGDLQALATAAASMESLSAASLAVVKVQDTKLLLRYAPQFSELLSEDGANEVAADRSCLNLPLDSSARAALKKLQKVVETKAHVLHLAPELLGRKKQLVELIRQYNESETLAWTGNPTSWRQAILEADFLTALSSQAN
ncbi:MAG: ribonuclease D [Pseudohongiellaceae bacterium]|jgi:ribonuclease D